MRSRRSSATRTRTACRARGTRSSTATALSRSRRCRCIERRLDGAQQGAEVPALPAPGAEMSHVLVVANETVAGQSLAEALERRSAEGPLLVTVLAAVNQPRGGDVVLGDAGRAQAGPHAAGAVAA